MFLEFHYETIFYTFCQKIALDLCSNVDSALSFCVDISFLATSVKNK